MPTNEYPGCTDCCGGGTVENDCCDGISESLTATIDGSGDCACADGTISLAYASGEWVGDTDICGFNLELRLRCADLGLGIFEWQYKITITGGGCDGLSDGWTASGITDQDCDPSFFVEITTAFFTGCDDCLALSPDTVITITE